MYSTVIKTSGPMLHEPQRLPNRCNWGSTQTFIQHTQWTEILKDNIFFPFFFSIFFLQLKFQWKSSIFHISESYCSFSGSNLISPDIRGSNILKSSWIILFGALIQIEKLSTTDCFLFICYSPSYSWYSSENTSD